MPLPLLTSRLRRWMTSSAARRRIDDAADMGTAIGLEYSLDQPPAPRPAGTEPARDAPAARPAWLTWRRGD